MRWYEALALFGALFVVMRIIVLAPGAAAPGVVRFLDYSMIAAIPMLGIGVLAWVRSAKRKDLEPNVLEAIVGESNVREFGDGHFALWLAQLDPSHLQIVLLAQNARAGEGTVHLVLNGQRGAAYLLRYSFPIDVRFAAAELVAACVSVPLRERDDAVPLTFSVKGHCQARGRRVRFGRYPLIQKPASPALLVAGALTGHVHVGRGGSRFGVQLQPGPRAVTNDVLVRWRVLWRPGDAVDLDAVRLRLRELAAGPDEDAIVIDEE